MTDKQLEVFNRVESNAVAISGTWINESVNSGRRVSKDGYLIVMPQTKDTNDRPLTSSEVPGPSTKSQDERFFLWACEKLLNENPLIQWSEIYRWCANEVSIPPYCSILFSYNVSIRPNTDPNRSGRVSMTPETQ